MREGRRRAASVKGAPKGVRNASAASVFERVWHIARQIPRGRVATYGQIARVVGTTPRVVGFAMAACSDADGVPWHRVVNARGTPSLRGASGVEQRARLEAEGVPFRAGGRIDLERWGWLPPEADRRKR